MGNLAFGNLRLTGGLNDKASGRATRVTVNNVEYESGDKPSECDNDQPDNGVEDGGFGLLKLAGIATGGHKAYTTDDDENDGDNAGDTNEPINEATNHSIDIINVDAGLFNTVIIDEICTESDTDGINNGGGKHDDGETDEGASEGLLTRGGFDWVTGGEHIEVAAVDYVAYDQVDGDDADVSKDVENDLPDTFGEAVCIIDAVQVDIAVPGWHAEQVATI